MTVSKPNADTPPHYPLDTNQCVGLIGSDFTGLHAQHAGAVTSFNFALQIVIAIETIPWIAAGALIQQKSMDLPALLRSAPFMIALLFTGLLGTVGYMILVHNRLLVNFYARCLNYYRTLLATNHVPMGSLPVDPEKPSDNDRRCLHSLSTIISSGSGAALPGESARRRPYKQLPKRVAAGASVRRWPLRRARPRLLRTRVRTRLA